MLPLTRPFMGDEERAAAARVLSGTQLTQGPEVAWFEADFAAYQSDVEFLPLPTTAFDAAQSGRASSLVQAVATNSCTSALYLTLRAMGVGPGDEVITSPISWIATAQAIRWTGADVVFADVDDDGLLDPEQVTTRISSRTRAIVPVHLYGMPCDIEAFADIAKAEDVFVVYDGAHAIEARYDGAPLGGYGDATCYSFHANKNVTTAGEGGMVVTRHAEIADWVRRARLFGLRSVQDRTAEQFGAKLNMTEVQAAVGRVQLRRVEDRYALRRQIWTWYEDRLRVTRGLPVSPGLRDALHLYPILTDRDSARFALEQAGIGCGVHYTPIYDHPEFSGTKPRFADNADRIGRRTLSLPFFPEMREEDVERVAAALEPIL